MSDEMLAVARKHLADGRLSEAENALRQLLQNNSEDVDGLILLADILCRRGDFVGASQPLLQAIAVRPQDAILYRSLGYVYCSSGKLDDAIATFRRGLELNSDDAETLNNLGVALRQKGLLEEAIECFLHASRLRPELSLPHRNLGELFNMLGKREEAVSQYEHSVRLAPEDAEARNGLGTVLALLSKNDEAVAQYEQAIRLRPNYLDAERNLATVLAAVGRLDEAVAHCQNLLRLRPDFVAAHVDLASALIDLGRFDEAVQHSEKALELDPNNAAGYFNLYELASHNHYEFSAEQLSKIRSLAVDRQLASECAPLLHYMVAGLLDKEGDFDQAFRFFAQANTLKQDAVDRERKAFVANNHRQMIDTTILRFSADFFSRMCTSQNATEVPVFIVGMPRSGTSLVEQIIASHPDAAGAGELPDINECADDLPTLMGREGRYLDCIQHAETEQLNILADRYLHRLQAIESGSRRIVDKMWKNFLYLGLIALMFPKARIVHCRRDAMDVCLSCFRCNFNSISWAFRLEDIGFYYREYARLMDHWREVLPMRVHEVSYEQLIASPEEQCRELIGFLGLEWNDSCLAFYKTDRPVQTASRVQVRQPIYTTSCKRWKKYEQHLAPLRQALESEGAAPEDSC